MNNKNSIFEFDPSVYKTRKSLEEYSIYNLNFIFKINKLSARVKRFTVRGFRKYTIGNYYIISPTHNNYYITAYRMFLDNKIFGHGPKSYKFLSSAFGSPNNI